MQTEGLGFRLAPARRAAAMAPPYPEPSMTTPYELFRCSHGVDSMNPPIALDFLFAQQIAEERVQEAALGIVGLARVRESLPSTAQSLFHLRPGDALGLIQQRSSAVIRSEEHTSELQS